MLRGSWQVSIYMLHVIAMSSGKSFWSKPRNRAVVYALGLLLIFGSYVIGSTESPTKKAERVTQRQSKIERTLPQKIEPSLEADNPVVSPDSTATATQPAIPKKDANGRPFPPPDFRLSDREYTDEEKAAIYQQLLKNEPVEYPYKFNEELSDLEQKIQNGTATEKDRNRYIGIATQKPELKDKFKDQNKQTAETASKKAKNTVNNGNWVSFLKSSENSNPDLASGDNELDQNFQSGRSQAFRPTKYIPHPHDPIPAEWNFTHENLRIYSVIPGPGASAMVIYLGGQKKISEAAEKALHEKYRIGPDYDNHFEYEGTPQQKNLQANQAANELLLTLGIKGQMIFEVTNGHIPDGTGVDFVIWSNPFCSVMTPEAMEEIKKELRKYYDDFIPFSASTKTVIDKNVGCYEDLAKVYVSDKPNGDTWEALEPCSVGGNKRESQCTGYGLNLWQQSANPFNAASGGDRYDIAQINMKAVRAIKIVDIDNPTVVDQLKMQNNIIENGYDLDAIAMLYYQTNQK